MICVHSDPYRAYWRTQKACSVEKMIDKPAFGDKTVSMTNAPSHPRVVVHPTELGCFALVDVYGDYLTSNYGLICSFKTHNAAARLLDCVSGSELNAAPPSNDWWNAAQNRWQPNSR